MIQELLDKVDRLKAENAVLKASLRPKNVTLNSGTQMPLLGLGTWKAEAGVVGKSVETAIKAGYRHIDCACDYGNEEEVGAAITSCIAQGTVTREELWVTSKLWNTYHAKEHVEIACRRTLKDLNLEYLDLYLIHFPIALKFVPFEHRYPPEWEHEPGKEAMVLANVPYQETWEAMENLVAKGLVRSIGVSNLCCARMMDLFTYAKIPPSVNQVELHPYLQQQALIDYCKSVGVVMTGFSPLGSSSYQEIGMDQGQGVGVLQHEDIISLASKYGKSPAQVVLRWNIQRGCSVVPKSTNAGRLAENIDVFDFELTTSDMNQMSAMDRHLRYNDPGEFCKGMGFPLTGVPIYN